MTRRRECLLAMGGAGRPGECTNKAEPKAHVAPSPLVQTWHQASVQSCFISLDLYLPSSAAMTSDLIRIAKREH